MTTVPPIPAHPIAQGGAPSRETQLREVAMDLETVFLAEMLKSAGMDGRSGAFSGGAGETQFASFLREQQARQMVRAGGIGLAESIFRALAERP